MSGQAAVYSQAEAESGCSGTTHVCFSGIHELHELMAGVISKS